MTDERDVGLLLLSRKHIGNLVDTGEKNRHKEVVMKPAAVTYYNSYDTIRYDTEFALEN